MRNRLAVPNDELCIGILTCPIVPNYYHWVVLPNNRMHQWVVLTALEVIERWRKTYTGSNILQ